MGTKKKDVKEAPIDTENFEYVAIPPDGGFGWVIAIAAMLCNLVCDGTLFAFGMMKIYLQNHFKCSDMLILMVGSVPCGVYLLVGPIVSGLANRYSCRVIIIIGSIGAAGTMALSTLSPNVWVMMVLYGVIGGIFFGMIYLPSVVMVSFYFEKKRAIANGIVTAGTGIGVLSFGPLAEFVMGKFGWKIGMLIFGGLMLSCILFGAIMKPLTPTKVPIQKKEDDATDQLPSSAGAAEPLLTKKPDEKAHASRASLSSHRSNDAADGHRGVPDPADASRPLYKKDAFFTGSKQELHRISRTSLNSNPYMATATKVEKNSKPSAAKAFADILAAMTDFSILKNKKILLICIGNIFSMLGYYLPIMCLVSFAVEDLRINQLKASFLLTIFGLFNTIGRFAGGFISMIPGLSPLRVHNAALYLAGISTIAAGYAFNFLTCALYAGFCGFLIAPHMSLMPNVILNCVGLDKFTTAFGILFLFRGAASIIGPPAAGFLKDYTRNYDVAFVAGGAMIVIAAFFHIAISFLADEDEEKPKTDKARSEGEQNQA